MTDSKKQTIEDLPNDHVSMSSIIENEVILAQKDFSQRQNGKETKQNQDGTHNELSSVVFPNDEKMPKNDSVNGDVPGDNSKVLPQFPFSLARVWISSTVIIGVYIVVVISLGPLTSQYFFHRIAQEHYNLTVNSTERKSSCVNSTVDEGHLLNKAQQEASSVLLYTSLLTNIPAFFICLVAGSVSDYLGRKSLVIISLSGATFKTVMLSLVVKLDLDVAFIYLGSAVEGLTGSFFVTTVAITSVISDITSTGQSKAVRFAILEGILLVSGALSQLAVGFLIESVGFFIPVLICSCVLGVTLLIGIFLLPETVLAKQKWTWNMGVHVKKTFRFYYAKRSNTNGRLVFIVGLAAHLTIMFSNIGKSTIETMFVLNRPICWSSVDIGIFGAVRMVIMSVAAVVLLKLCRTRLSLEVTGMICGVSAAAGFILEGFADSTVMMYLSSVAGILFTAALPIPRTLLSHSAASNEQGALFSSMSCIETFSNIVSATIYTMIYNSSLDTFKGAVFMVMAAMCLLHVVSLGAFRHLRRSKKSEYEDLGEDSATA